jgi:hypothetical protein
MRERFVRPQPQPNRRKVLASTIGSAPLAALFSVETRAAAKAPQTVVQYQPTPKGGLACAGCNSFMAPNQCKLVAGEISPSGWCRLWTKKEA